MAKPKLLKHFPPQYAALAERSLNVIMSEFHLYMLSMVSVAENMPNRHTIKTPNDVIGLAIEDFAKGLHKRAKNIREAKWAVDDLLEELGFNGEEATNG